MTELMILSQLDGYLESLRSMLYELKYNPSIEASNLGTPDSYVAFLLGTNPGDTMYNVDRHLPNCKWKKIPPQPGTSNIFQGLLVGGSNDDWR